MYDWIVFVWVDFATKAPGVWNWNSSDSYHVGTLQQQRCSEQIAIATWLDKLALFVHSGSGLVFYPSCVFTE